MQLAERWGRFKDGLYWPTYTLKGTYSNNKGNEMDMTQEQWERLGMMVENPSREGINNILLTVDKNGEWEIKGFKREDTPDSLFKLELNDD